MILYVQSLFERTTSNSRKYMGKEKDIESFRIDKMVIMFNMWWAVRRSLSNKPNGTYLYNNSHVSNF
jgi:hypothetical protein